MNCCRNLDEAFAATAKERDELKKALAQRELELKGANAACGALMSKLDEAKKEAAALRDDLARAKAVPLPTPAKFGNKITYLERKEVYSDALELYGMKGQCMKAIEKMSKLTEEIAKGWFACKNLDGIIEGIADVTIMMEQLRLMFGINDKVCAVMDDKIARLREQIERDTE